ncbi:MAG: hypothetical protein KAT32_00315 [Candidatus Moranbacteria bacterium]|nr:hypothetical protein [Candidatus Moranbacteria bacterium]
MEEQNKLQEIKRPWQGTAWAWLNIVGTVFLSIIAIILLLGFAGAGMLMGSELAQEGLDPATFIAGLSALLIIIAIPLLILEIFLIIGFFKGWKWAVIVAIIFEALGIMSSLFSLGENGGFFNLLITGFMLYLAIACVQHPFYNKKK